MLIFDAQTVDFLFQVCGGDALAIALQGGSIQILAFPAVECVMSQAQLGSHLINGFARTQEQFHLLAA